MIISALLIATRQQESMRNRSVISLIDRRTPTGTLRYRSRGRGALAWPPPTAPAPRRRRSQNIRRGQGCGVAALATPLRRLTQLRSAAGCLRVERLVALLEPLQPTPMSRHLDLQ